MKKILFFFSLVFSINGYAQSDPCSDGTQPSCQCNSAPLLCSFDELDGYTFSMSSYSHPNDGPEGGMCFNNDGTTSNNPTWFAFVAGCPNLTLRVHYSGCNDADIGPDICAGVQASVYGDCNDYLGTVVGCSTVGQCNATSGSRTVTMTALIPGKTYYFLVDGCCGSACTNVQIEVLTPPCPTSLGDWPSPLTGPDVLGINTPGAYTFNTIFGGIYYPWYINGVSANVADLIENDPVISFTRNFSFSTLGVYQLCVDVLNDCVSESSSPSPLCKTISVLHQNDNDEDGILNEGDNCINISNPDQLDSDNDTVGDLCDNCPTLSNPNQEDCNNNNIGDICEPFIDTDCDGIYDSEDNCPGISNHFQIDQNNNNIGDACEDFPKLGINTQDPKSELHLSNGSLFIDNPEKGIILKDYQGNCFIIKVVNNTLALQQITCPN